MNRFTLRLILLAILFSVLVSFHRINTVKAGGTVYINADGSIDPPTANITSADNVTYTFTDNIYDSIVVERNNITIDGADYKLEGTGASGSKGIDLTGRSNVTIKNMKIGAFYYGIYLYDSSYNNIYGNNITSNFDGVYLIMSSYNTIQGNNVTNNNNGIVFNYSSNNFLQSNLLDGNQYGFGFLGLELSNFLHSIDSSNLVDGKPVYYLISQHGIVINPSTHPGVGFLALINSANITVEGLTMTNNRLGLLIAYTNNTKIQNNNLTNNLRGIMLYESSNNSISGNNIIMNGDGVYLGGSSSNAIFGNNVTNNNNGIVLDDSSNNTIYHNNFVNNAEQVYSYNSTNIWDNGYPSGGNYWSDYAGVDEFGGPYQNLTGCDGIGDNAHEIDADNIDHYPLMEIIPEFPTWTSMLLILIVLTVAIAIYKQRLLKITIR